MSADFVPYQPLNNPASSYDVVQAQEAVRIALDTVCGDVDLISTALSVELYSTGGVLPDSPGPKVLTSTDDVTLPTTGKFLSWLKNGSTGLIAINAPSGYTIFADVAGYSSIPLSVGDAVTLGLSGFVWYVV